MNDYLTAGELAKLAATTKRTILFYDEKGILKPIKKNASGYRLYTKKQVLDYQKIHLLSTLGVTLGEIKKYFQRGGNLTQLFDDKKTHKEKEINQLKFNLNSLKKFSSNLKKNGTMVNPTIKIMAPFDIYYIEKIGPYAKIGQYCRELLDMFSQGKNFITMTIFKEQYYNPKNSHIKISVIKNKTMRIKNKFKTVVKTTNFNPGKVITYTHHGSSTLLSLFWKELEKYCRLHKIKVRKNTPDFEIYRHVNEDITKQFFEIYLPID